jgi:hypothetical protein
MPKFDVRLIREVTDIEEATVTVEAESEDRACEAALAMDPAELTWENPEPLESGPIEVLSAIQRAERVALPDGTRVEWDERLRTVL